MTLRGLARRLVESSVGALLAPAGDPRRSFAHAYQNQRELLAKVRLALSELAASKSVLEARLSSLQATLPGLEESARAAVVAGNEAGARSILRRAEQAAEAAAGIRAEISRVAGEELSLALIEQRLATQIEAFYARQEVLAARYTAADAQYRINEALTGVSQELADLGLALEQAEESAEEMRARADALDELAESGVLPRPGLDEPEGGEAVEAAVEVRLAEITAEYRRALSGGQR